MVLAELGGKLRESLRRLHAAGTGASKTLTQKDLNNLLSDITRALIESDVNVKLVMKLRDNVKNQVEDAIAEAEQAAAAEDNTTARTTSQQNVSKLVQKAIVDELVALLSPGSLEKDITTEDDNTKESSKSGKGSNKNRKKGSGNANKKQGDTSSSYNNPQLQLRRGKSNVILFVGLQGAGKTTTIGKYANYYSRRGYKVAMVCADTFRAGAFDQLKQNATKLRIPFYGSYVEADPVVIAEDGVSQFKKDKYEIIIVDTSGRHKQETALFEEMQEIRNAINPTNVILVMDATQGQAIYDQALAFHNAVDVGSVIITKLDGHAKGGGALSAVAATQAPIIFTGSGEHFDDLDPFNAQSFVSKLLGFGDVRGLMEAMKDSAGGNDKKSQEELMEKMSKGEFTLRDMYKQFTKVLNIGPLNKLMGMVPGMPEYLMPKGEESTQRLRKFMVMMDSMNDAELDGKVDMHKKYDPIVESRIRRIAAGSGTHPNEVKMLLVVHKQFEGMVSKMGKSGMMSKQAQQRQQQLAAQMKKNPNLINQRLNQMDPKLLQQMGGRENVMAMMQQMAKGGGGPGGGMSNTDLLPPGMGMPGMGMPPPGGAGGGMPNIPGLPPLPPGMNMEQLMQMAQSMGMGGAGGGMPGMGGMPGFR